MCYRQGGPEEKPKLKNERQSQLNLGVTLGTEEVKSEKKTLEKIVEQIGPYGLIAVCVTLVVNIASRPLESNSLVSLGIIGIIIAMSFFMDWIHGKNFRAIEQLRIKSELEYKKHKSWEESTKPLIESSRTEGQARMERTKLFHAIIQLLEHDLKEGRMTTEQQAYCQDLIKRLRDLERTIIML